MGRRILILEDDACVARALIRHLERTGCEVLALHACAELEGLEGNFDLGVFDLDLPDGRGADAAERLLGEQRIRSSVFFTGTHDQVHMTLAARLGPVVAKSQGVEKLLQVVDQHLRRRRLKVSGAPDAKPSEPPPSRVANRTRNGDGNS